MREFSFHFKDAVRAAEKMQAAEEELYGISDTVAGLRSRLTCEGELKARLDQVLQVQSDRIFECGDCLGRLRTGLERSAARYAAAEDALTGKERKDNGEGPGKKPFGHGGGAGFRGGADAEDEGKKDFDITKFFVDLQKKFAEMLGDKDAETGLGLFSGGLSYFYDLKQFFTGEKKGASGASDYLKLTESSSKLWEGLYKYLKQRDASGQIEKRFGKAAAAAGIGGSVLGYLADLAGAMDYSKYETPYAFYSNFIGSQGKLFDTASEIYDAATKADNPLVTPSKLWATFAKTILSTGRAAGDSIVEYTKDGVFTSEEMAAVGVDASVAGLTTGVYELLDTVTFGTLETFAPKKEVIAQNISNTLKDGAKNAGSSIGNYIKDHQDLLNEYRRGGIHEFTAFMKGAAGRLFGW